MAWELCSSLVPRHLLSTSAATERQAGGLDHNTSATSSQIIADCLRQTSDACKSDAYLKDMTPYAAFWNTSISTSAINQGVVPKNLEADRRKSLTSPGRSCLIAWGVVGRRPAANFGREGSPRQSRNGSNVQIWAKFLAATRYTCWVSAKALQIQHVHGHKIVALTYAGWKVARAAPRSHANALSSCFRISFYKPQLGHTAVCALPMRGRASLCLKPTRHQRICAET